MADYKTHITTSTVLGAAYGTGAFFGFGLPLRHCFIAGGLCGVAGMLPDLDSKSGIPQREMLCFASLLIPVLMLRRFEMLNMTSEDIVFASMVIYLFVRFVIGRIFRRFTKHRGMWHSLPAAAIAGMATFLVCLSPELGIRLFKAWAVVIGFLSHLVLDEIYAVDWNGNSIRLKKSFGTALKMFSGNSSANLATYGLLILVGTFVFSDATVMEYLGYNELNVPFDARDWINEQIQIEYPDALKAR